ncbi:MAG: hypothetical protein M3Y41_19305 [Pseudomonadota bacterium]|nr:hypothetical protein [Pseudomonadota bacterium]MDQ2804715.1 hypothetical protein [Pseudomonadota bacterium]
MSFDIFGACERLLYVIGQTHEMTRVIVFGAQRTYLGTKIAHRFDDGFHTVHDFLLADARIQSSVDSERRIWFGRVHRGRGRIERDDLVPQASR